jgi:hypothetical protein
MQISLVIAAFLCVAVAVAHSYLGERAIIIRLFRQTELPKLYGSDLFTRRTIRFAWHITSVAWLGFGALLLVLARGGDVSRSALLKGIGITFIASAILTAGASRGRHLAWIVFLAIGLLAWIAA